MDTIRVPTDGVELSTLVAGPEDGPLVVLLHGFPEYSGAWDFYVERLAEQGFRVVAPDQRGYGDSSCPQEVKAYPSNALVNDIVALIRSQGKERAVVIGHDWGAVVAWWIAQRHPERVEKLIAISGPHPRVMKRHLRHDFEQLRKSWYMGFFQIPKLPELVLSHESFRRLKEALTNTARPGTFSSEDIAEYESSWERSGLTGMLNWYRAPRREPKGARSSPGKVKAPALILWGAHDHALKPALAQESAAECESAEVEIYDRCTHWLHHEEPERVLARILSFIRG